MDVDFLVGVVAAGQNGAGSRVGFHRNLEFKDSTYENDNDDGTLIGNVYIGTQGLVKTSHIVWDFLIQHSKDAVDED